MQVNRIPSVLFRQGSGQAAAYLSLLAVVSLALVGFALASLAAGGDPMAAAAACPVTREGAPARELVEGALVPTAPEREVRGTWM